MTTARQIITSALTLHLNRLSPGEALDDDLASVALDALNDIADEFSGTGTFLWRTRMVASSSLTGQTGTLGSDWAAIDPGQEILGATFNNGAGDFPLDRLTMEQYHEQVRIKTTSGGLPRYWAYDGDSTVYFYPMLVAVPITLRVHDPVAAFATLDEAHTMPNGYKSGLAAILGERIAPAIVGDIPPAVVRAAARARNVLRAVSAEPGIIGGNANMGNVYTGWR